ncbi:MAG: hypothetical protein Q9183_006190 [Haloplaca sp. 2 TL-2023]
MANKKIVVVFGATGNQGGSVIKSILSDPKTANEFKIRAITRDPSKPNAKALEAQGVETVAGDINSKDDIQAALQDAYAVFAVTNYWEKMDESLEEEQGRNIADLSKVFLTSKQESNTSSGPPSSTSPTSPTAPTRTSTTSTPKPASNPTSAP